ncbi:MAG: mechanosensitive ion channel family protein [Gallionella sp.]|nr:mechanosensitive ion channel family protein [Gallionella sp.]
MNTHVKSAEDNRQVNTLARVFRYVATVIISLIAIMLALDEIGISVTPILGAAGVVGIAVGFGAQSLVKDYFTGFFLLLENQIRQGDAIEVCGKSGQVEDITLRYVRLRDNEGNVHYIPNGQITLVTNKSCDYAFAVIDISVAYHEDLDKVYDILKSVGDAMQSDTEIGDKMLAPIEIQGIQTLAESTVMIRCRFKTVALEQWSIRRKFLGRVKQAFDTNKIDIPYSQITVNREKYARIA